MYGCKAYGSNEYGGRLGFSVITIIKIIAGQFIIQLGWSFSSTIIQLGWPFGGYKITIGS